MALQINYKVVVEKALTIANVDGAEEGRRGVEKAGGFSSRRKSENRSVMSEEKVVP